MTDDKLQSKFNEQETFVKQMNEAAQKNLEVMKEVRAEEQQRIKDRQEQNREENVKRREDELAKKAQLELNHPRPMSAPAPRAPTGEEIREKAIALVEAGEVTELQNHNTAYDLAEKKLIERGLQREVTYQNTQDRDR